MENNTKNSAITLSVQKSTLKDVFFYFFAFITLCYSIFHFLSISFDIIDQLVKDTLNTYNYYYQSSSDSFRFSVASLAVVFPVFVAVSWYINKAIEANTALAQIRVRAIFIWLSITVSSLTMMGSLVTVIYFFLGGEYTTRFFLKTAAVFITAALVGGYYTYLLRRDYAVHNKYSKYIAVGSVLLILSTIIYGVYVIGTPSEIRKRKLDGQRYDSLYNMTSNLENSIRKDKKLPESLNDLSKDSYYGNYNYDPETQEQFKYKVLSNMNNNWQYEVCANFSTAHERDSRSNDYQYYGASINSIPSNYNDYYNNDYKVTITGDDLNKGHRAGENCMTIKYALGTTTPSKGVSPIPAPYYQNLE